jgi:RNA polymerase primary sigma factor
MERELVLKLLEPALAQGRKILLSQLNRLLPVDMSAEELDGIFFMLDDEGIQIVDDALLLKEAKPTVRVDLTQKADDEPQAPDKDDEELASNQRWYHREISKIPLLTESEEVRLGELARAGDAKAAETIVQSNLRLVVSIAKKYAKSGVNMMDLIQAGNEGLMDASTRYDPAKGRFASFAKWWIRQAIVRAISASWHTVRIPKNLSRECGRVLAARDEFKRKQGRAPSAKEVGHITGFPLEHVEFLDSLIAAPVSLDAPIPGADGLVLENTIADQNAAQGIKESVRRSAREVLDDVLGHLEETQRRVLALRFGLSDQIAKPVEEVAKLTGLTRDKVRAIEKQALRKLRAVSKELNVEVALREHIEDEEEA